MKLLDKMRKIQENAPPPPPHVPAVYTDPDSLIEEITLGGILKNLPVRAV